MTHTVTVPGSPGVAYPVHVEAGALADLAMLLAAHAAAHRYLLVTDTTVARFHADAVYASLNAAAVRADLLGVEPGERSKNPEVWAALLERMARTGAGRDACVIAMGGGVVGDLGGFAAATFMRGIPLVQVPTTLLAMVDAAVGGKTGLDLEAGKNLVGVFHWPRLVVCDPAVLVTLPQSGIRSGLAEAVKHGAIADAGYAEGIARDAGSLLAADPEPLTRVIARSVAIKAEIVAEDPLESGRRAALNFGHTVAHALERISGYRLPHGEAVAIGMVAEARIGERIGATEPGTAATLASLLASLGLPVALPAGVDGGAVLEAAATDKKARQGRTRFTLIARMGQTARDPGGGWTWAPEPGAIIAALTAREAS